MTDAGIPPGARPAPHSFRWLKRIVQTVVVALALLYLVRLARNHASELGTLRLTIAYAPLLAASLLTFAGYLVNVAVWVASLRWWGERVHMRDALRIWFLSNLARFIPGVVWQFAGLAGMSYEVGLSPVAATGAVLLQQVGLLCTGILVSLLLAPIFIPAWTGGLSQSGGGGGIHAIAIWIVSMPTMLRMIVGIALASLAVALLPVAVRLAARLWERMTGRAAMLPELTWRRTAVYLGALVVPWMLYGVAFWLFGKATIGNAAPSLTVATAAFVTSYVAGIIVVIAPAGIGVREVVLYAALAPAIGARDALVLSVLSRLWLVAVEVAGALVVLSLPRAARPD
jgi:uncharacterized membrane protein YbhN (UPF0104 family)